MRALLVALLCLTAAASGCLGGDEAEGDQPPASPEADPQRGGDAGAGASSNDTVLRAEAPELSEGRAWTYETSGVYDTGGTVTIVLAEAGSGGYLFAGQAPDDLVEDVSWDRVWLGPTDLELNPEVDGERWRMFDFPLEPGKSWQDRGETVTVTTGPIHHPNGTRDGFVITRSTEDSNRTWTYDPEVGYMTSYTATWGDTTYLEIELTEIGRASTWTWWEEHTRESAGDEPSALTVPADASAVVVSTGGWGGGRAQIAPPPGGPASATYTFESEERWVYDHLDGAAGTWTITAQSPPEGFGFLLATAVTWTGPGAPGSPQTSYPPAPSLEP